MMVPIWGYFLAILFIVEKVNTQLTYYVFGAVTSNSLDINAKVEIKRSLDVLVNGVSIITSTYTPTPDADNFYNIKLNSLSPNTQYAITLIYNNTDTYNFNVRTFPLAGSAVNLTFVASSNVYEDTKSNVFEKIANMTPSFAMVLGNIHNKAVQSKSAVEYEKAYAKAFSNDYAKKMYNKIPLIYSFNDLDFQGESGSDSKSDYLNNVLETYSRVIPHYTLPSKGIYQKFQVGNVLFIMLDSRTFMDTSKGVLYGTDQLNWFNGTIQAAANDASIKSIIITTTQEYNYVKSAYDWDMIKQDHPAMLDNMQSDKAYLGTVINDNIKNFRSPNKDNFISVQMLVGERHLALDNGEFNPYGSFPVAVCGVLDYWLQCRGGPWSHGSFHDSPKQFCKVDVYTNSAGKGCVKTVGYLQGNDKNPQDQNVFVYDTCHPDNYPARIRLKCPIDYREKILNGFITLGASAFIYVIFFVLIYRLSLKAFSYTEKTD
jgi:hypothetical protein